MASGAGGAGAGAATSVPAADAVQIDVSVFKERVSTLNAAFKKQRKYFGHADALAIVAGKLGDAVQMSSLVHLHLFGYEFPTTIMVLVTDKLYILASKKKAAVFKALQAELNAKAGVGPAVEIVELDKSDGYASNFEVLLKAMTAAAAKDTVSMGVLGKEDAAGKLIVKWEAFVKTSGFTKVDASRGLNMLMSAKDSDGITNVRYASVLSERLLRKVLSREIKSAISKDQHPTHKDIAAKAEAAIGDKAKLEHLGFHLDPSLVDLCVTPTVQSGGNYSIRPTRIANDDRPLSYDTVLACVGGEIKSYKACVGRTLLFNPTELQKTYYNIIEKAHTMLCDALHPGQRISDVVKAMVKYIEKQENIHGIAVAEYMSKSSFGHGVGLAFKESNLVLNTKNQETVKAGMTFVVTVSLHGVPLTDRRSSSSSVVSKLEKFDILLVDTVVANAKASDILTSKAHRELADVSWEIGDGEEEDEDEDEDEAKAEPEEPAGGRSRYRSRRLQELEAKAGGPTAMEEAQQRAEKQVRLRLRQKELALEALKKRDASDGEDEHDERADQPIIAYTAPSQYPQHGDPHHVRVDRENQAVLVPIFGMVVPFHISCIKSVSATAERSGAFLRLNFYHFGGAFGREASPAIAKACQLRPNLMYIKTLNFKSKSPTNLVKQARLIKDMQKRAREKLRDEKEEEGLVEQKDLQVERQASVPRLQGLSVRPHLSGRKSQGTLEAHKNGLRFTSSKNERLDVLYSNIKHAIYQPCQGEHQVLIHFHLKNALLIKKKKVVDIQFYTEVIDVSQAVDVSRRSAYDPDEYEEENRENKMRQQLNRLFKKFVDKITAVVARNRAPFPAAGFEMPSRDLGFFGVPDKSTVFLIPCTGCLVSLTTLPPFVLSLDSVEHVHFERVLLSSKNFDMVFIMKNGHKAPVGKHPFVRISMVPTSSLEDIKTWLTEFCELTYTETANNLRWEKLIPEVVRQPDFYADEYADGESKLSGWDHLIMLVAPEMMQLDDSEQEESGSAYSASDFEAEEDDDDEDDYDEAVDDDADESEYDESDDDGVDAEADDWDTLEKTAIEEDRRKRGRWGEADHGDDPRTKKRRRKKL